MGGSGEDGAAAANPVSIVFILIVNACFEYELKS
jgi:hypothetical protein